MKYAVEFVYEPLPRPTGEIGISEGADVMEIAIVEGASFADVHQEAHRLAPFVMSQYVLVKYRRSASEYTDACGVLVTEFEQWQAARSTVWTRALALAGQPSATTPQSPTRSGCMGDVEVEEGYLAYERMMEENRVRLE